MSNIQEQLYNLGISPGDVILMHSSMKALGPGITPEGFLLELMSALTGDGTLLLPALTYESVTPEKPYFSATKSEPCVGILPRTFMRMDGVIRSMHPTHSVCARGAKAELMTRNHILDNTPVGLHSPFMLLPENEGKLLFVGDVLHACTMIHGIEEVVDAPYTLSEDMTLYTLEDSFGNIKEKNYYRHDFKNWELEYTRIRDILTYPDIRTGVVCAATCTLIDAIKLKTAVLKRFQEDIYAFVSPVAE